MAGSREGETVAVLITFLSLNYFCVRGGDVLVFQTEMLNASTPSLSLVFKESCNVQDRVL